MTVHFPDLSPFQGGISMTGAPAVALKVTEGTGWPAAGSAAGSWYVAALGRARAAGAITTAYHFLHAGSIDTQARFCHSRAGGTPLMLDAEPTGTSRPGLADIYGFIDAYRRLGGLLNLCYLPRWYWQQIGSPGLGGLASRKVALWSSSYTGYTDSGPGWQPYGGLTPSLWQHTDRHPFNGQNVDFSAFRGDLGALRILITGGSAPPPPVAAGSRGPAFPYGAGHYLGQPSSSPYCHSGYWGGADNTNVHTWQAQMVRRGWKTPGGDLAMDGRYGPDSEEVCRAFQAEKSLPVDGKAGPVTWAAAWTAPIT